ncbi:HAD-IA family hydrolase [Anaerococcus sp. WCA-380-WT-2B]|uniref:HAD-IA family hydrolase n=1 Tax=Anaerococcus porci TaxID=2652269 RepID=A0A6N7VU21_9FIRM|nr:HAD-IA family hydrolase [Anaerococcus porci]
MAKLDEFFFRFYISDKIGYEKPNQRFFTYILNDLNLNKQDIIMLGDSLQSDIKGAFNFGIDSIYFNKNNLKTNKKFFTFEVNKLNDIFNIL